MELHRLDGLTLEGLEGSGLDNLDIQDIDFEMLEGEEINGQQIEALEALGYVHEPEIAYEILDEDGNVVMYADAEENLYVIDGLGELGFFKKIGRGLKKATKFVGKKIIRPVGKGIKKAATFTGKKILKPVVKTFNRFLNPATILLRNGFLLAMKTNLMKVAERLRFGYLSDAEARKRGMSMSGFSKLKGAISKANKIYELAGGKSSNLKKAILTGKGNRDKSVPLSGIELGSPLNFTDDYADPFERMVIEMDADEIESMLQGTVEMEGLGVVVTGSAIAAASGAVGSVAAILNKITGVFDKGKKVVEDAKQIRNRVTNTVSQARSLVPSSRTSGGAAPAPIVRQLPRSVPRSLTRFTSPVRPTSLPTSTVRRTPTPANMPTSSPSSAVSRTASTALPATVVEPTEEKQSFLQKNKTALLIGAGVLVVGGGVFYVVKQSRKKEEKPVEGIGMGSNRERDSKGRFKGEGKTTTKRKSQSKKKEKLVPTALL
ncbi:hypothetical protein [Reichenbachiella sp.]